MPCRFSSAFAWITLAAVAHAQVPVSRLLFPGPVPEARLQPGTLMQQEDAAIGLHIVVLEGEDGVNIVKKKTAVKPVVEVRDRNKLPVAGVAVTFAVPTHGTGVVFLNGSRSVTLMTDSTGRVAVAAMKPVGTGPFNINISASYRGQVASGTISQTNYATVAAAASAGAAAGGATAGGAAAGGLSTGMIVAIVAGVAAVGIGVGVGLGHGGSNNSPAPPSVSIGAPGTVSVGGPH